MKITYFIAIIIYVLFIFRAIKCTNKIDFALELLLFSIIAAPGIKVGGIIIHFSDIAIPCMFFYFCVVKNERIRLTRLEKTLLAYIFCIFVSLVFNMFYYDGLLKAVLQALKVLLTIISAILFHIVYEPKKKQQVIFSINLNGILLCLITIVSFLEQDNIYASSQYMWLGSLMLHRAGGVYGESSYLGCFTVFLLIFSLMQIRSKVNKYRIIAYLNAALSIACNIISYTRISNIAMMLILIIMFFYKITYKKIIVLSALALVAGLGISFNSFLRTFVFDRMLSIFDFNRGFNNISSGRLDVWKDALNEYVSHGNFLFGVGYKNGFFSDNNFLMSLVQMGVFGIISNIMLTIYLLKVAIKNGNVYALASVFALLIMSMTCDVLTYYKPISIVLLLYDLVVPETKLKTQKYTNGLKAENTL